MHNIITNERIFILHLFYFHTTTHSTLFHMHRRVQLETQRWPSPIQTTSTNFIRSSSTYALHNVWITYGTGLITCRRECQLPMAGSFGRFPECLGPTVRESWTRKQLQPYPKPGAHPATGTPSDDPAEPEFAQQASWPLPVRLLQFPRRNTISYEATHSNSHGRTSIRVSALPAQIHPESPPEISHEQDPQIARHPWRQ